METRELEAFVAVAEELHFGSAADRLHMSQPPLSNRIKQLERRLKLELFKRSTRKVELTPEGRRLLPAAQRALHHIHEAERVATNLGKGNDGLVKMGFAGISSHRSLPRVSRAIKEKYPQIDLQLQSQAYVYKAVKMIQEGELDIAFSRLPTPPDLASRIVSVEDIICAIPEGHPLAKQETISMGDLSTEEFVGLQENQGSILQATMESLCVAAGFRPNVVQTAPDSATVMALVTAGAGITITLSSVAENHEYGVQYRRITGISPSHMFPTLIWREEAISDAARRVLEVAEEVLPTPDLSEYANNPFIKSIGRE